MIVVLAFSVFPCLAMNEPLEASAVPHTLHSILLPQGKFLVVVVLCILGGFWWCLVSRLDPKKGLLWRSSSFTFPRILHQMWDNRHSVNHQCYVESIEEKMKAGCRPQSVSMEERLEYEMDHLKDTLEFHTVGFSKTLLARSQGDRGNWGHDSLLGCWPLLIQKRWDTCCHL